MAKTENNLSCALRDGIRNFKPQGIMGTQYRPTPKIMK